MAGTIVGDVDRARRGLDLGARELPVAADDAARRRDGQADGGEGHRDRHDEGGDRAHQKS
jgi:hypothetical protein